MSVDTAEVDTGVGVEQTDMFSPSESGAEPSVDAGADKSVASAPDEFADLPEGFMKTAMENDPELKALVEGKKPDVDKGGEDHAADGSSGEDSATDEQKQEPKADEKDSGKGEPAAFADDVIPGIKGEDFGKLPEELQGAIAQFYTEAQEKAKKAEALEAALAKIEQDPYLSARMKAAEAGMEVPVRGMTPVEVKTFSDLLVTKLGLNVEGDAEDREALADVMATLKPGLDAIAKQMAQDYAAQSLRTQEVVKQAAEVNKQADELLFGLSQFDKSLAVKETDISKFYALQNGKTVFNDKHPEIEAYKNGIGKFVQWAFDHGMDNRQIVKMGAKAFYAAAAAGLGKSVAVNTADRDKKIAAEARRNAINLFRKTGSGTLATQGSAPAGKSGAYMENGIDVTRLATDGAYFDELIAKRPGDMAWIDKLSGLEEKGRAILNNRKQAR
jgi:hypothetical protein